MALTRIRVAALLLAAAFAFTTLVVASGMIAQPASAAKKKKCKKGYQRVGKKCKRKPFIITPAKLVIVAGKLREGMFSATGYAEFPPTPRAGVLKGHFHLSNGLGFERVKFELNVAKGLNSTNWTTNPKRVGITGETVTATLVIQGTQSNAFTLIK